MTDRCGCRIEGPFKTSDGAPFAISPRGYYRIKYCLLHAKAQEMYEALTDLVNADACNYTRGAMRSQGHFDVARLLLATIEGLPETHEQKGG